MRETMKGMTLKQYGPRKQQHQDRPYYGMR